MFYQKTDQKPSADNQTNFIFLSLYLILLTFFIFLVSISVFEKTKIEESKDSIHSIFKGEVDQKQQYIQDEGIENGGHFIDALTGMFKNIFKKTFFEAYQKGEYSYLKASQDLFFANDGGVSEQGKIFLDQLYALMDKAPTKEMEVSLYASYTPYFVQRDTISVKNNISISKNNTPANKNTYTNRNTPSFDYNASQKIYKSDKVPQDKWFLGHKDNIVKLGHMVRYLESKPKNPSIYYTIGLKDLPEKDFLFVFKDFITPQIEKNSNQGG